MVQWVHYRSFLYFLHGFNYKFNKFAKIFTNFAETLIIFFLDLWHQNRFTYHLQSKCHMKRHAVLHFRNRVVQKEGDFLHFLPDVRQHVFDVIGLPVDVPHHPFIHTGDMLVNPLHGLTGLFQSKVRGT